MRIVLVMANVQGQAQYDNLILLQLVALSCVASGGAA